MAVAVAQPLPFNPRNLLASREDIGTAVLTWNGVPPGP